MGAFEESLEDIEKSDKLKFYILVSPSDYHKSSQTAIIESFQIFSKKIGKESLVVYPNSEEMIHEIRSKFSLRSRRGEPVLIIIDCHPLEWERDKDKGLKISLGKIKDSPDEVVAVLESIAQLVNTEYFLRKLTWKLRLQFTKKFLSHHIGTAISVAGLF